MHVRPAPAVVSVLIMVLGLAIPVLIAQSNEAENGTIKDARDLKIAEQGKEIAVLKRRVQLYQQGYFNCEARMVDAQAESAAGTGK